MTGLLLRSNIRFIQIGRKSFGITGQMKRFFRAPSSYFKTARNLQAIIRFLPQKRNPAMFAGSTAWGPTFKHVPNDNLPHRIGDCDLFKGCVFAHSEF